MSNSEPNWLTGRLDIDAQRGSDITHTIRSGAQVQILSYDSETVTVRYIESGAIRTIPRESM